MTYRKNKKHHFDFDNTKILHSAYSNIRKRRLIAEAYINKTQDCINFKTNTKKIENHKPP